MRSLQTEAVHTHARGLDALPVGDALAHLLDGQRAAVDAVRPAIPDIARAAEILEAALRGDGRLIYCGAGSSALMANADGMELAGTFGIDPSRVILCMAGGLPQDARMPGATEDDADQADRDASDVRPGDAVIAVTASGRTPYPLRFAELAQAAGACVICIANNPGALIFSHADVTICLATPPELIAGSTRMGAGSAQKVALNMMSTLLGIRLGHVFDGMMVNLRADNDKLRARATGMVARIAGTTAAAAREALQATGWSVKAAVLHLAGAADPEALLTRHQDRLRSALQELQTPAEAGS